MCHGIVMRKVITIENGVKALLVLSYFVRILVVYCACYVNRTLAVLLASTLWKH